ncbi:hypothetical protein GALL_544840 [mine drainage metagenome]|uniref:Metal dependent phosphohydrolase n=1 Tax=mine drainage metagenome TaxID=410659 RepID=A0A1J5P094_9ZZZZ
MLCDLVARDFALHQAQRDSLVQAALTMNVSMTVLQDQMATQYARPDADQKRVIKQHSADSATLLIGKGITDALWLEVVQHHHLEDALQQPWENLVLPRQLAFILHVVDRYAALISPRQSREGQSATDSAHKLLETSSGRNNTVEQALIRIVGLCPPGTFVLLKDKRVAIVTRRTQQPNQPDVAVVMDQQGKLIRPPLLHHTTDGAAGIESALLSSAVQERISHHLILQLGRHPE